MFNYKDLIETIKNEKLSDVSPALWTRVEQTLAAKHENTSTRGFWKIHPFWSSASVLAACAVFMILSVQLLQTVRLNSYLKDVNLVMNSPDAYYSETKYSVFSE